MYLVLLALVGAAQPLPTTDPELECRAAITYLEKLDYEDRLNTRLFSSYDVDSADQSDFDKLFPLANRQLTLNPNRRVVPIRIPGSNTLWAIDLRSMGWNDASWRAVALRDKAFREPWVSNPTARRLRGLIGENQPENYHVVGVVSAFGFYRRTYDTFGSSDYYDLLFAEQRYPKDGKTEGRIVLKYHPGGIDKADGKVNPAGWYEYVRYFPTRKLVNFPKNQDEWLGAFLGGVKGEAFETQMKLLKATRGAVMKGSEDDRKGGSFVARNNRLVFMRPSPVKVGALYGETFDVNRSAGKKDLEENAFTDQDRDKKRVIRDGGELIMTLPGGDGIATLVINAKGDRVEVVPPEIAIHTRDPRNRQVRNGSMACLACHGDAYGWIPLNNVIEKSTPDEIDVKFRDVKTGVKDRQAAEDFDSFFMGWQDDFKGARETTKTYWLQATGTEAQKYADGMTGASIANISLQLKWKYDDPLDMAQMVRETGLPEGILRVAASRLTLRRAIDVARKAEVTRAAWDDDIFPEIMKVASSHRERIFP